jgi:hypothetical protein
MTTELPTLATPLDELEFVLSKLPQAVMPLVHMFTDGLYVRQIEIPAGTLLTSMEHTTEHPFVILSGVIDVISCFEKIQYTGPCVGITKPGTKRVLFAHSDTVWLTFHPNPENTQDPEEIGKRILAPVCNPLFESGGDPAANLWRNSPTHQIISQNQTLESKS